MAARTGGGAEVSNEREVSVAGQRALAFDLTYERDGSARLDRLVFLLVGRREFQLTCSMSLAARATGEDACALLQRSFRLTS